MFKCIYTYKLSRKWTSVRAQWAGGKAQISMTCSLFIGGYSLPSLEQACYLHGPRVKDQKDIGQAGEKSKWNGNIPDSLTEEIEIFPLGNRKGLGGKPFISRLCLCLCFSHRLGRMQWYTVYLERDVCLCTCALTGRLMRYGIGFLTAIQISSAGF